ncbi:protein kinase domain-containing protein [Phytoactinopolyspora mesophila]|uniref:protein kinase domain-containing protein n=1 Tax=Phytoactinopolyspora mesophila TaxID=2650750 RepID=UPI00139160A9|nr:protein kinase [Phytoactinopolyspora mesophila]
MRVPGYTAVRRLGSANSSMWLGTDDATGNPVTLRLVKGDPSTVKAGLSSAILVMRALQHPHVIPVIDLVDSPAGPVLVLGPAEGGSLADILMMRRILPAGEMVTACAPIAEALAEIHQHGIVHGAITPDEIVFAHDGRPMLAGIGIASIGGQVDLSGPTIAPEVVSGVGFAPPADVYSIAAMGVVALTGPVSADRLFAASAEHLLATGVAPAAQAVITRAIGRNVGRRPAAETLVNALYAIADPEPVELVSEPEPPPATHPPGFGAPPFADPLAGAAPASAPSPDPAPRPAPDFDPELTSPDELDDVTAYMRQVAAPPAGRRARRGNTSGSETSEFGGVAGAEPAHHEPPRPDPDPGPATEPGGHRARGRRSARGDQVRPPERSRPAEEPAKRRQAARSAEPDKTAASSSRGRSGSRRPSKGDMTKVASGLVVLLLVAGAVILGMQIFGGEDDELPEAGLGNPESVDVGQGEYCGGPRPAPEEEPPEVSDWTQEVQRLYSLRSQAFEEVDAELLCQVYAPTSEGLIRDVELMQEWADHDVRPQNLSFEVIDVELIEQHGGTVVLEISDRLPPYELVDNDGEVVDPKEGIEDDTWSAELVPIADDTSATPTWRFG